MHWRLLEDGAAPASWNMAVDEAVLTLLPRRNVPTLRLYAWAHPTLSLGYFQPASDVDRAACAARGIALVRRSTGGRAVLHADEVTYAVAAPLALFPGGVSGSYRRISAALLGAVRALGLEASLERSHRRAASAACFEAPGFAELKVEGRKAIGSAQTRTKAALLQHGSVPLTFDAAALAAALGLPARAARALRRQAAGLNDVSEADIAPAEVRRALVGAFAASFEVALVPGELHPDERALAQRLAAGKYASLDWRARKEPHAAGR